MLLFLCLEILVFNLFVVFVLVVYTVAVKLLQLCPTFGRQMMTGYLAAHGTCCWTKGAGCFESKKPALSQRMARSIILLIWMQYILSCAAKLLIIYFASILLHRCLKSGILSRISVCVHMPCKYYLTCCNKKPIRVILWFVFKLGFLAVPVNCMTKRCSNRCLTAGCWLKQVCYIVWCTTCAKVIGKKFLTFFISSKNVQSVTVPRCKVFK